MSPPRSLRWRHGWLLLVPAAAALVLFAARTVAERRAEEEAMSAELLAPMAPAPAFEDSASGGGAGPPPALEGAGQGSAAAPEPGATAPASAGDPASIVPPELAGALVRDSVPAAPPEPPPLDPALFSDWSTYDDAVAHSRATGRPVLLAFTALGCETCESLRESVFDDEAASVTMRSAVIPVRVHDVFADAGAEARLVDDLQKRFGVTTFPTLVVWSPRTQRLRVLKGYRGTAATLRFITDAASAVD